MVANSEAESPSLTASTYHYQIQVPPTAIDVLGHVNNIEYVRWLQDAAIRHSDHVGLTWEACQKIGAAFVVRRLTVDYLRPVVEGERLAVKTWVEQKTPMSALRHTEIRNEAEELVTTAETVWVYVSLETRRPVRIPAEVRACFELKEDRSEAAVGV